MMSLTRALTFIWLSVHLAACGHVQSRGPDSAESHSVPIYFPVFKGVGQFPSIPCAVGQRTGNCILDTGANMSLISINSETSQFPTLYKVKSVSAYGEQTTDVVQVNRLMLGDAFIKKDFAAVRGNQYHDLPEYLAVVGADILKGTDFIFYLGQSESDPAKLIFQPSPSDVAARNFKHVGPILPDKRFIAIKLSIGGVDVKAIWDTHMGWTSFSKNFIRTHSKLFKFTQRIKNKDAAGMQGAFRSHRLLQPICLTSDLCVTLPNDIMEHEIDLASEGVEHLDVILGNDVIWRFKWYFDFTNRRFAVQSR